MILSCLIILVAVPFIDCDQVTCFCDRESCDDKMLCQGDFCVIGVRRDDNGDTPKLRQHCGTLDEIPYLSGAHSRCEERIDNWQEVCKCEEDLCNTFVYLRSSFDSKQDRKDLVSFIKQDVPYPPVHHRPDSASRNQNSSLIVLLVIIPLSVGGFAVCLIFLNYHCKMC